MTSAAATTIDNHTRQIAPDTVRIERLLEAAPERVWDWLVDPEKRARWFAGGTMEPKKGGRIELVFRNSELTHNDDPAPEKYTRQAGVVLSEATVVELDPPHRFVMDWFGSSRVTFELEPQGTQTRLTLTHEQVSERGTRVSVSAGWHAHLDILAARLAGTEPPAFWRNIATLERDYEDRIQ